MLEEFEQQVLQDIEESKKIEDPRDEDQVIPFKYSISSYGADYDVDGLVRRLQRDDIIVPDFQRQYVWTLTRASRFIESLLLGLPVPGIFLAVDPDTRQLLVIDGQQRLRTLRYFYEETFHTGVEFALKGEKNKGIQPEFEGKTYSTLLPEDRRRLDNSIIHATVIKQEDPQEDDSSSIYYIFERLNTGGMSLQPQEIRASIFQGEFYRLLKKLNQYSEWRDLYGPVNSRMKDQELILRFFALYYDLSEYKKPLVSFLNRYMHHNRNLQSQSETELVQLFTNTVDTIHHCLGKRAFRPRGALNAPVYDAVMYGIAKRLQQGAIQDCDQLQIQYDSLMSNDEFKRLYNSGTTDETNMRQRLQLATEAFEHIP
jgi:uncharacterized protein with ParB-like and HNH nuclease domain